jgi:phosphoserine phosphatase
MLSQEWPLSVRQLHSKIVQHRSGITYHAVHKAARQLLAQGVLRREKNGYMISIDWIENLAGIIEQIKGNYLYKKPINLPGLMDFKQEGDTQTFIFETLAEAEAYRKRLQWEYLLKKGEKPPYCAMSGHLKSPLVSSERALNLLNTAKKANSEAYVIVSGNTPLDEWCADYYRNNLISVQTGVPCAEKCDVMILGDVVTQLYMPPRLQKYTDQIYHTIRDRSAINDQEFYRIVYNTKAEVKFVVIKNPAIAEQLRQQVLSNFRRERLSIFDINDCLVDGFLVKDFADYLLMRESFDRACDEAIKLAWSQYKKGALDYEKASNLVLENFALGLRGQQVKKIEQLAQEFVDEGRVPLFKYSRKVFNIAKSYTRTVAITKVPMLAEAMKPIFPFDFILSAKLEAKDGIYTGKMEGSLSGRTKKAAALKAWMGKNKLSLKGSMGFGDSQHALGFLSAVDYPVVLNPTPELLKVAKKSKWAIHMPGDETEKLLAEIKKILQPKAASPGIELSHARAR